LIRGSVTNDGRSGVIDIVVQGLASERIISAVVDTGFTGALTLPSETIQELALLRRISERGTLADGSEAVLPAYLATVLWDGAPRRVRVLANSGAPLVGMGPLRGYELTIQVLEGGEVRIVGL
jgi:clan AA aspartic protease